MSGEMILAICVGLSLVASGALAYWGAIRSFRISCHLNCLDHASTFSN